MARRGARREGCEALERLHEQHQALMRVYRGGAAGGSATAADLELLRREFRFVRDEEEDAARGERDWRVRMSVRYYRRLFREYALADLSRFQEGKIGLRWRTEAEVVAGKGQFSCGNKRCDATDALHSYELLFAYKEQGEKKRCLVKLRVCPQCARKLFYKKLKEREERRRSGKKRRRERDSSRGKEGKRRRRGDSNDGDSSSTSDDEDIHQQCAAINELETREIRDAARPSSAGEDAKTDEFLAKLIP